MEKLVPIFIEAQKGTSNHRLNAAKKLVALIHGVTDDEKIVLVEATLRGCLDQCLLCTKKEAAVENMVTFLATFISTVTDEAIFSTCIEHLLQRSKVLDKNVRMRVCHMISSIIKNISFISNDEGVSEELLESITKTLLPRLSDKIPGVRVAAIKALHMLQDPTNENDVIIKQLIRLMNEDISKDVRVAAVELVSLSTDTLPLIITRIRDIKPEIRIAVCKRLQKEVHIKALTPSLMKLVVQHGLNDRDVAVKNATCDVVLKWLQSIENNVPKLLVRLVEGSEANEEEAELLGNAILEAAHKRSDIVSPELHSAIRQQCPAWDRGFSSLRPSEILWAYLRCEYTRKNLSPLAAVETLDALMPDMVKLCALLEEAHKPNLCTTSKYQYSARYLLRMTAFLDTADVCGCKELSRVCEDMIKDINLPEILIEPVISSWSLGNSFATAADAILAAVVMSKAALVKPSSTSTGTGDDGDEEEEDVPLVEFEDDEEIDQASPATLRAIRSLQIVAWSLEKNIGNRGTVKGSEVYDEVIPFVQENLSQLSPELRSLSVRCLGLLSLLSDTHCRNFVDILFQVARNEIEDGLIRSQALEALVDIAAVYERFKDDSALTNFLLRLQEGAEPALLRVSAEGSAKLLFAGRLSEPKLFANLLKFFFLPELTGTTGTGTGRDNNNEEGDEEEEEERGDGENAYLGSAARLQQILSIFFQAFFVAGDSRETIAYDCISDLVADIAMLVRDREIDANALSKVCNHLLSLCDNIRPATATASTAAAAGGGVASLSKAQTAEESRKIMRIRLTAAISRETLKLGNSKVETAAAKEFVKALGTLSPASWIDSDLAPIVRAMIGTLLASPKMDKTAQKQLEKFIVACDEAPAATAAAAAATSSSSGEQQGRDKNDDCDGDDVLVEKEELQKLTFYALAPGLADLMALSEEDHVPSTRTRPPSSSSSSSTSNTTTGNKAKAAAAVAGKGGAKGAAAGGGRGSKVVAKKPSSSSRANPDSSDDDDNNDNDDSCDDNDSTSSEAENEDDEVVFKKKVIVPASAAAVVSVIVPAGGGRARIARSSKLAAASKITSQLEEDHSENVHVNVVA